MSKRFNNGSHYENHERASELHESGAHAHLAAEQQHGKQDHLTGHEHSRQELEHSPQPHEQTHPTTFGHKETEALALEIWQRRGCPTGSPDEDWFLAVEQLRSHAVGH